MRKSADFIPKQTNKNLKNATDFTIIKQGNTASKYYAL